MVNTVYRKASDRRIDFRTTRYLDKSYCNIITTYSFSVNFLSSKNSKKEISASELTYKELTYEHSATPDNLPPTTAHFVGLPLDDTWHPIGKEEICQQICDGAVEKYESMKQKEYKEVYMCRYEMAELHLEFPNFFHIAGRILSLSCRAFGYELELNHTFQERIEYKIVNIAKIYILTKAEGYKDIPVPLVILVTRDPKIDSGAVAQTLGYFCKGQGRKTSTKQGLAILLNGYNNKVQVKIFTYPYYYDPNE